MTCWKCGNADGEVECGRLDPGPCIRPMIRGNAKLQEMLNDSRENQIRAELKAYFMKDGTADPGAIPDDLDVAAFFILRLDAARAQIKELTERLLIVQCVKSDTLNKLQDTLDKLQARIKELEE